MGLSKRLGCQMEEFPKTKLEQFDQKNRVVLDYNPKYNLNICKSRLTQISNQISKLTNLMCREV